MCREYLGKEFDITIKDPKGKIGYKLTSGNATGWYWGTPRKSGWMKAPAVYNESSHYRAKYREGFHGFCFFFTKKEALAHKKTENIVGTTIRKVRVKGLIKEATTDSRQPCKLAQYIRFYAKDGKEFE